MPNKFVVVFCEGNHDVMFLYRILRMHGYTSFTKKLREFPFPLSDFLISEVQETSVEELNLDQIRQRLIPTEVLSKDEDTLIIIYALGGDTKKESRLNIITTLRAIKVEDPDAFQVLSDVSISIIYFFDADNKGVGTRIDEINSELNTLQPEEPVSLKGHCDIANYGTMRVGVYIFCEGDSTTGKLEDIILPLMEEKNEEIFEAARKFLDLNRTVALFKDGLTKDATGRITKVLKKDFDHKKSLIGISGQLQISGKPNGVYIRESAYITEEKIKANLNCKSIVQFFDSVCA